MIITKEMIQLQIDTAMKIRESIVLQITERISKVSTINNEGTMRRCYSELFAIDNQITALQRLIKQNGN
jgi:hypothetical protein